MMEMEVMVEVVVRMEAVGEVEVVMEMKMMLMMEVMKEIEVVVMMTEIEVVVEMEVVVRTEVMKEIEVGMEVMVEMEAVGEVEVMMEMEMMLMMEEYGDGQGPVTDTSAELHRLCGCLELLLQFDQKEQRSFLGARKDYWDFLFTALRRQRGCTEQISFVCSQSKLKTSLGKGRAFIRLCLACGQLAESMQLCLLSPDLTREWYGPRSPLLCPELQEEIFDSLYALNGIAFNLDLQRPDLDEDWPMFSESRRSNPSRTQERRPGKPEGLPKEDPRYELQLAKEQVQRQEQLLQAQERELQTLQEQLSRCEAERARLQMMLEQKQQEAEMREAMYEKELEGQRDLVRAMKRRVLELIHEKDHQWQRLQQLSTVATGHCADCNKVFRRLSRRYPCRLCGGLVCHACSADYKKREHCCPACAQREEIQIS
ncbi:RUN and FYVE domain-containing protein 4 [Microtus ochrogaster]|uniref:RUN and FYVE domain-containing protein 4 n=1 Tax=Microtus ochrogaster TaxID=79684 RepID=A0A8J6KU99_MICOH|nr:RUN and FYVE domain-containing protein 4 [Microtus ochrogaster]